MNKKTIGIPRAFLYYRYKILWKNYFSNLGYKIVVSGPTTKETVVEGKKYSIDEIEEKFSVEKVTKDFFERYKENYCGLF